MVKVDVFGGLGNQIWQYGAALALAQQHNSGLVVQVAAETEQRRFLLDNFRIDCKLVRPWRRPFSRFYRLLNRVRYHYYVQPQAAFYWHRDFFLLPDRTFIASSYMQNYRYLLTVLPLLRQQMQLKEAPQKFLQQAANINRSGRPAVAVHVRRGDYLQAESAGVPFHFCSAAYYHRAMAIMRSRLRNPQFFFFTNDYQWTRANFLDANDCRLAGDYSEADVHYDFALMKECQSFILANSSLSAIAALLANPTAEKIVIAPRQWLTIDNVDHYTADFMPPEWQLLEME